MAEGGTMLHEKQNIKSVKIFLVKTALPAPIIVNLVILYLCFFNIIINFDHKVI